MGVVNLQGEAVRMTTDGAQRECILLALVKLRWLEEVDGPHE